MIRCWADFWKRTFAIETVPCGKSGEESSSSSSSSSLWLVFAPRQLLLLAQSTSARQSWNLISILVIQLLTSGLLRYKDVQEQCLSVVRHDWPQVRLLQSIRLPLSVGLRIVSRVTREFNLFFCFFFFFFAGAARALCNLHKGHCRLAEREQRWP